MVLTSSLEVGWLASSSTRSSLLGIARNGAIDGLGCCEQLTVHRAPGAESLYYGAVPPFSWKIINVVRCGPIYIPRWRRGAAALGPVSPSETRNRSEIINIICVFYSCTNYKKTGAARA